MVEDDFNQRTEFCKDIKDQNDRNNNITNALFSKRGIL